jgi:tetratricopeptide (TPR) repeat protein/transglutaminase-like putative cysteine protease
MVRFRRFVTLGFVLGAQLFGHAQTPSPNSAKKDYSQEPAVIEELTSKITFENDGNSTRSELNRIRIQTDAGVKEWGLLRIPYQSGTQTVEIDYVRVRKADGTTVVTPPDNVQDMDAEITRSAPFYSDLREKHVAVKGLGKGDTLEYEMHWHSTKPLTPGQFWFDYSFQNDAIVLQEKLEISVPSDRAVKVKGPLAIQTVTTQGGYRVYAWTHSNLERTTKPERDEKKEAEAARGLLPQPDVQISSFESWDEVGRWYWNLQKDRIDPSPAIRAKAAELTKGLPDDAAKLRALYTFVSMQYRYIGIAFGIGRYQPHSADDVLGNSYGDCKDKHTLLASLMQASGIALYPALVSSSYKIDTDIPSPAQFDHVIGYLPQGNKGDAVWLDTTPEVAPFGYLVAGLRDKQALVMQGEKSIQLMTTPTNPPVPGKQTFKIDSKLSDDGTLKAKIEDTAQGDAEVTLRAVFRQIPEPQWKDLVQQISYGLGFAGTVSDINVTTPDAIGQPFHFSYSYDRKDYPDWSNRQFSVPGLPFFMPQLKDDAKYPLWLGPPLETESDSKVELPKGYDPQVPANVDLKYDFAEYHASYSRDGATLVAKRRMVVKAREIPVAAFEDYRNFVKNMQNDVNRYVQTTSAGSPAVNGLPGNGISATLQGLRDLPDSNSHEANQLVSDARDEMAKHDPQGAVSSLYRAVAADPKFTRAWIMLGELLLAQKQTEAGMDAFHKAAAAAPDEVVIPKVLGWTLMSSTKFEDAITVWQDFIKAHPQDADGPANLGNCMFQLKRYSEAATAYEAELKIGGERPDREARLATAYLRAGQREKASAAFSKLANADPGENALNDAAYEMANADLNLPLALDYAKKAVHSAELESQKISLPDLKVEDLGRISKLAAYWDTLGWVDEHMSKLDDAELFIRASWRMMQDGVVAGHLCHLYERTHRNELAIKMCRMAIYRMPISGGLGLSQFNIEMDAAKENLNHLIGAAKAKESVDASDEVIREREFKLPRFLPGTESAEFFVLLASDGKSKTFKVEDVKFISGSDKMKPQGKQIKSIPFDVPAPGDAPTRFVRRGILGCYQYSGCSFVLLDPASVHSLN